MMRLRPGTTAPSIRLPSIAGTAFDLASLSGRPFLLSFYRFATCPFCNLRVRELVRRGPELGGRLELVAIFDSPLEHLQRHADRHHAPFPILADASGGCYRAYGVARSAVGTLRGMVTRFPTLLRGMLLEGYLPFPVRGHLLTMPADFLIDGRGIIRAAHYGQDEGDHLSFGTIAAFAALERRAQRVATTPLRRPIGR